MKRAPAFAKRPGTGGADAAPAPVPTAPPLAATAPPSAATAPLRLYAGLLAAALLLLSLTGCGFSGSIYANYRSIAQLRLIRTLGYDREPGGGVSLSASSGALGEDKTHIALRQRGESILKAMENLQSCNTDGLLYFSHVQNIVVGRSAAEAGLGPLLDFAERDTRMRLATELYVLLEGDAGELVADSGGETDVTEILTSVKEEAEQRAVSHVCTLRETAISLSETGAALVSLLRPIATESDVPPEDSARAALPQGYGILRHGALAGVLEGRQAEAVSLLLGYPGTVRRRLPDGAGGTVTLQCDGAGAALRPLPSADAAPSLEIRLKVRAAVAETEGGQSAPPDPDALCAALGDALEENLRDALALSAGLDADFLGLGPILRRGGAALPEGWLQALHTTVTVEAVLDRDFDLTGPVRTDGSGG